MDGERERERDGELTTTVPLATQLLCNKSKMEMALSQDFPTVLENHNKRSITIITPHGKQAI